MLVQIWSGNTLVAICNTVMPVRKFSNDLPVLVVGRDV